MVGGVDRDIHQVAVGKGCGDIHPHLATIEGPEQAGPAADRRGADINDVVVV